MKGVSGLPPIVIQGAFGAILVLGILVGATQAGSNFVKKEALGINADRIDTTALTLKSTENSSVEIEVSGYEYRIDQRNISLRYQGEKAERKLKEFETIYGPREWNSTGKKMCLDVEKQSLNISAGDC